MANVTIESSSSIFVSFSDEERDILLKATEILGDISLNLFVERNEEHDEVTFFFSQMKSNLENVLKGKYEMS